MKKIMFNDQYVLTAAVLNGRKTQTRRIINAMPKDPKISYCLEEEAGYVHLLDCYTVVAKSKYKIGEIVAVAQKYRDIPDYNADLYDDDLPSYSCSGGSSLQYTQGWDNKMFVEADLMPHQIEITKVRVERLQDISDADCLAEGIEGYCDGYEYSCGKNRYVAFKTPKIAYSSLIDKISGKGTFESNPWVFVYNFKLFK